MRIISHMVLFAGFSLAVAGPLAGDAKKEAIEKDRQGFVGLWRVVSMEIDGKKMPDKDAKEFTIVNGLDGTWAVRMDTRDIMQGTSEIDPAQKTKTIDFTPTDGEDKGKVFLGIYEIKKDTRKLCFAPTGKDRPTEFSSDPGSGYILITCAREKTD